MNAVILAVSLMLILSLSRVHIVLSLFLGALAGGLWAGLGLQGTLDAFQIGLSNGAQIALSYAMLGAFAVAIAHSGLPSALARFIIEKLKRDEGASRLKILIILFILTLSILSQNLIPIHIAFIPLIIPPLLGVFNRLQIDRRLLACVMTFGLVTTYMWLPYGFGEIFLRNILLSNLENAGLQLGNISNLTLIKAMTIPALGMLVGLFLAIFISYRKPRLYNNKITVKTNEENAKLPTKRLIIALSAIVIAFIVQLFTNSLILGAMIGFLCFMITGIVRLNEADSVFNQGIKMMAMVGFIMIAAQGFAEVMNRTGHIESLVTQSANIFQGSRALAAFAMLFVGLLVTMGIGSSFSTLPIIASIYVPLCLQMGFSPIATLVIIATAGALGDAGSPASDSTLGPTAGLNADGEHDHIRDSVIPTFIHFNIPLLLSGWLAAMLL